MHFQNQGGVASDRVRVVVDVRLVGGPDFAKPRAARFEQLRDAEAATDLQQLAA